MVWEGSFWRYFHKGWSTLSVNWLITKVFVEQLQLQRLHFLCQKFPAPQVVAAIKGTSQPLACHSLYTYSGFLDMFRAKKASYFFFFQYCITPPPPPVQKSWHSSLLIREAFNKKKCDDPPSQPPHPPPLPWKKEVVYFPPKYVPCIDSTVQSKIAGRRWSRYSEIICLSWQAVQSL